MNGFKDIYIYIYIYIFTNLISKVEIRLPDDPLR